MLDIGRQEISLQAKRRDLLAKIAEGRSVVASLQERQALMVSKIEEATAGLRRLEEQLRAMETVINVLDEEGLVLTPEILAPIPLRPVPAAPAQPFAGKPAPRTREPFKPLAYLRCVSEGHQLTNSRSSSGYVTCTRCRIRRRM